MKLTFPWFSLELKYEITVTVRAYSCRISIHRHTRQMSGINYYSFRCCCSSRLPLGYISLLKMGISNKVRIGIKWLEMFFSNRPGGVTALFHRHSLRNVSAVGLPGQRPTVPCPSALSRVILLSLFSLSGCLNCTIHGFKSITKLCCRNITGCFVSVS